MVALLVGVFGRVHDPTLSGTTTLGYPTVLAMKTVVATAIAVLAIAQVATALWMYGKLGLRSPSWLGTVHRTTGATALLLSLFVAYHCLWSLGLEVGTLPDGAKVSTRTLVHGLLGCTVVGAMVVKIVAVRSRRAPGWFLPVAGGLLFSLPDPRHPDLGGLVHRREGVADPGRVRTAPAAVGPERSTPGHVRARSGWSRVCRVGERGVGVPGDLLDRGP